MRRVVERFVHRVYTDPMIGFFFARFPRERLIAMETEFASAHLGGPVEYTGRPLSEAHRAHAIARGHFDRRATILREVLEEFGAPSAARDAWLAHVEAHRAQIVRDASGACPPPA